MGVKTISSRRRVTAGSTVSSLGIKFPYEDFLRLVLLYFTIRKSTRPASGPFPTTRRAHAGGRCLVLLWNVGQPACPGRRPACGRMVSVGGHGGSGASRDTVTCAAGWGFGWSQNHDRFSGRRPVVIEIISIVAVGVPAQTLSHGRVPGALTWVNRWKSARIRISAGRAQRSPPEACPFRRPSRPRWRSPRDARRAA